MLNKNNRRALLMALTFASLGSLQAAFKFPADKVSHFSTGATLGGFGYAFTYKCTHNKKKAMLGGFAFAATFAVGKEYLDRRLWKSPWKESAKDIGYTMLGTAASCFTIKYVF